MGLFGCGDCYGDGCGDGAVGISSCTGDGASCTGDFSRDSTLTCCSKSSEPTPSPESLALRLTTKLGVVCSSFPLALGGVSSKFPFTCSVEKLRHLEEEAPSVKVLFLATLEVNAEAKAS